MASLDCRNLDFGIVTTIHSDDRIGYTFDDTTHYTLLKSCFNYLTSLVTFEEK